MNRWGFSIILILLDVLNRSRNGKNLSSLYCYHVIEPEWWLIRPKFECRENCSLLLVVLRVVAVEINFTFSYNFYWTLGVAVCDRCRPITLLKCSGCHHKLERNDIWIIIEIYVLHNLWPSSWNNGNRREKIGTKPINLIENYSIWFLV